MLFANEAIAFQFEGRAKGGHGREVYASIGRYCSFGCASRRELTEWHKCERVCLLQGADDDERTRYALSRKFDLRKCILESPQNCSLELRRSL